MGSFAGGWEVLGGHVVERLIFDRVIGSSGRAIGEIDQIRPNPTKSDLIDD